MANETAVFRALASDRRRQILEWLKDPRAHFQPTLSEHMRVLSQAGLVRGKRIKQWTFYRRDENRIRALRRALAGI